ncbi:MFS transporter [Siccirubricoccus sp. KC 17139]|uniref:MFS transporter n=1 Tax=Siccirubricoccus soli TaxID=2899147 RepID=A0ABT1D6P3_9PROT|nr:MFS transporter [Siccirubricoccus soli]MCO6417613.1 MFS transporter [Siccirubricoccus soli]MCP2683748.1 MFS transporter [Siccirubricoccus soli]
MSTPHLPNQSRLILLLGITAFAGALSVRVTDPFIAVIADEFAASPDRVALLASAFAVPFALIQPILGPVGDALGKRRVIRFSLLLLSVMALIAPFASSLDTLMLLRALTGMAAGGIMPLTLATIGDAVPMKDRQVALSRVLVFAIGGQIGGGVLAGLLAGYLGWRGVLGLCGGVALLASFLLVLIPFGGPPEPRRPFEPVRAFGRYRALLGMPAARLLFFAVLVEGMLVFGTFPYLALLLGQRGLAEAAGATFEAGLTVGAFGCGGFAYGALVKAVLARIGQGRMVVLGGVLAGLALLGFGLAPTATLFIASGLVLGVGFYMVHNSIQTRVTEVAPEARGSAVAMHAFHFFIGQSLGPVVIGLMLGGFGPGIALGVAALGILALALKLGWR